MTEDLKQPDHVAMLRIAAEFYGDHHITEAADALTRATELAARLAEENRKLTDARNHLFGETKMLEAQGIRDRTQVERLTSELDGLKSGKLPCFADRALDEEIALLRRYFEDTTDTKSDWPCLPKCDSFGHEDGCPHVDPAYAFRGMIERTDRLTSELAEAKTTHCLQCGHPPHPERLNCPSPNIWQCLDAERKFYQSANAECERLRAEKSALQNERDRLKIDYEELVASRNRVMDLNGSQAKQIDSERSRRIVAQETCQSQSRQIEQLEGEVERLKGIESAIEARYETLSQARDDKYEQLYRSLEQSQSQLAGEPK